MDFEIPLTYPSSSIKCSSPRANSNKEISIDCKIQKDFYNIKEIFIEPIIIKKKNKEILFVNKTYLSNLENINCIDYNQKQLETSKQKYDSNSTFVQTNTFNIIDNRILFNLIIYSLNAIYEDYIQIFVTITKRLSSLRNLQEIDEEKINCKLVKESGSQFGKYICEVNSKDINNKDQIETFIIESDEMPGFSETNTNPIETDENIQKNKINNYSEPEITTLVVPMLKNINFEEDNCINDGIFKLKGDLINKDVSEKGLNYELNFINPPDSGAICSFNETKKDSRIIKMGPC